MGKVDSTLTFAQGVVVLKNSNIWILDTIASTHITLHGYGISNGREAYESEKLTIGVGESVKPLKLATSWDSNMTNMGAQSSKEK